MRVKQIIYIYSFGYKCVVLQLRLDSARIAVSCVAPAGLREARRSRGQEVSGGARSIDVLLRLSSIPFYRIQLQPYVPTLAAIAVSFAAIASTLLV